MNRLKLFAFPFAGGSSNAFNCLKPLLEEHIEFIPVELAGRGKRINEELYEDIPAAIDDLCEMISPQIAFANYAFFGHSLGSLLAHELTIHLRDKFALSPCHLFFSGRGAINVKKEKEKQYHKMDEVQFRNEVLQLGGTPPEFFQHPELLELFLPLLKNDFRIAETRPNVDQLPVNIDITVFNGKEDDLSEEQIIGWNQYTNRHCNIHLFDGGHFFLFREIKAIAGIINDTLKACMPARKMCN